MKNIYDDGIPSQEEIKKVYKNILIGLGNAEDLIRNGQVIEYFGLFFDDLYEIFKSAHYAPKTLDDANNYLMQNYYQLDKVSEITGVYSKIVDGKEKLFNIKINKNNFYNAYYMPIWKNLNLKDRAQILKWHFDNKRNKFENIKLKLRFIEPREHLLCGRTSGACNENDWLYINNQALFVSNPFELIMIVEHEFEHINQHNGVAFINKNKKQHNLYEKLILGDDCVNARKYPSKFNLTKKERSGLYLGYIMEQKAEKRALKEYEKINKANIKLFGVCDEQEQETKKYIWRVKYRNGFLTIDELKKTEKLKEMIEIYKEKRRIIKQADYFSKLYLLWKHNNQAINQLNNEARKIKEAGQEKEKQARLIEIEKEKIKRQELLNKIDSNYIDVLRNKGKKLPKSTFDELDLEDK